MGELTNALQGKLNSRKGLIKDPSEKQLDLFSSLSERAASAPKFVAPKPEPPDASRPEPEMVLPPSSGTPPDVSADVRAVLSESGPARPVESASDAGHLPLRTGIYHRPSRSAAPLVSPPPPSPPPPTGRISPWAWIRNWFAGVEMDRRMVSLVAVLAVLVAALAFWSACPRQPKEEPETAENAGEIPADSAAEAMAPAMGAAPAVAEAAAGAAPSAPELPAAGWQIAGAVATQNGGAVRIRFVDPAFESLDNVSIKGMAGLKAVAEKLATLKAGTRVVVTGYTDDVPLSRPTDRFQSNADIAAARAQTAVEHLARLAGAGKALAFEARTGDPAQAPYPNDSPKNRRLNRTVTVEVFPAP